MDEIWHQKREKETREARRPLAPVEPPGGTPPSRGHDAPHRGDTHSGPPSSAQPGACARGAAAPSGAACDVARRAAIGTAAKASARGGRAEGWRPRQRCRHRCRRRLGPARDAAGAARPRAAGRGRPAGGVGRRALLCLWRRRQAAAAARVAARSGGRGVGHRFGASLLAAPCQLRRRAALIAHDRRHCDRGADGQLEQVRLRLGTRRVLAHDAAVQHVGAAPARYLLLLEARPTPRERRAAT